MWPFCIIMLPQTWESIVIEVSIIYASYVGLYRSLAPAPSEIGPFYKSGYEILPDLENFH